MRDLLADPSLARYAGQFVWLALDFDNAANAAFLAEHGTLYTPTFYIVDVAHDRGLATVTGAMSLDEVVDFIERGKRAMTDATLSPAEVALAEGDALTAHDRGADAIAVYERAAQLGGHEHPRAVAALTWTQMLLKRWQDCADTAAADAPSLPRDAMFGRVVVAGMSCANHVPGPTLALLEPLAIEAVALPSTVLDHRFGLYDELITAAKARGDRAAVVKWGEKWLADVDALRATSEDEREAIDIARNEAALSMDDPARALPALASSAQAHADDAATGLRLAQVALGAKHYDDAIAACDRALPHARGPMMRSWLLRVEGEAQAGAGRPGDARDKLDAALAEAQKIALATMRERAIARITKVLGDVKP